MRNKGSALIASLIVVILVPIVVYGTTHFVSSSLVRYSTQNRNVKALYLSQAGVHRAIFNIKATGNPLPVADWNANNTIAVTLVAQAGNIYQLKSVGTSISSEYPAQVSRTTFAEYDSTANTITISQEGDGSGVPPPCGSVSWPFSEGLGNATGTAPYQGTLTPGSPNPQWVAGVIGNALRFNQNNPTNYVVVADPGASSSLDLTTAGTVMAWIDPVSIPNQAQQTIVHKGGSTTASNSYALFLNRTSANRARIRFWIYQGTTQYLASGSSNAITTTGGWYHVAGVWDSTGLRVYLNGFPDGTTATSNRVANVNNNSLYMGASGTLAAAQEYNGIIDEVYVYNCRKTDDEIKAYYNATCAGSGATPCPRP